MKFLLFMTWEEPEYGNHLALVTVTEEEYFALDEILRIYREEVETTYGNSYGNTFCRYDFIEVSGKVEVHLGDTGDRPLEEYNFDTIRDYWLTEMRTDEEDMSLPKTIAALRKTAEELT